MKKMVQLGKIKKKSIKEELSVTTHLLIGSCFDRYFRLRLKKLLTNETIPDLS